MEGGRQSKGGAQKPDKPGIPAINRLFDKNIIGDLAKRETEKKEKERKESTLTFDTSKYRFSTYNERLKEQIENIWIYPSEEAARGIYGELIIRFTIKKNGRLGAVELVRTSGYKSLDDAAIKALRDGEPYWPLPNAWGMDAYTIEGHFIYTIYGYYVR
jgi:protein TonB